MWKIFKYSRRMDRDREEKSFCGTSLETISQVILHSQPDSQGIRKERWLHVFTEGGKMLELVLSPSLLEIRLCIVSACRQELVVLERIELGEGWDVRICTAKKVLRCRHGERRFQAVFFSTGEMSAFEDKLGSTPRTGVSEGGRHGAEEQGPVGTEGSPADEDKRRVLEEFLSLLLGGAARTSP